MTRYLRRRPRWAHCLRLGGLPIEPATQTDRDALIERIWRERVARNIERRRAVQSPSSVHITHDPNWIPPYLRATESCALLRRQGGCITKGSLSA